MWFFPVSCKTNRDFLYLCADSFFIDCINTHTQSPGNVGKRAPVFLFASETPKIRVFFSKWINYISSRKKSLKTHFLLK